MHGKLDKISEALHKVILDLNLHDMIHMMVDEVSIDSDEPFEDGLYGRGKNLFVVVDAISVWKDGTVVELEVNPFQNLCKIFWGRCT